MTNSKPHDKEAAKGRECPEWESDLRYFLWLNHGHKYQYGDDGEMQCSECAKFGAWDYKREPIETVIKAALSAREEVNLKILAVAAKDEPHDKEVSNCCQASVRVDTADEGTSCYICNECEKPCDAHDKEVEGWEVRFNKEFPCIDPNCNNYGSTIVYDRDGYPEQQQCRYCYEERIPKMDFIRQLLAQKKSTGMTELQLENFLDKIYHNWNPDSGEDLKWHNYLARALLATFSGVGVGNVERMREALEELPLEMLDREDDLDASEFKDNASKFLSAMRKAKAALNEGNVQ